MYLIGIDVGTGSARAGVFDLQGQMLGSAKAEITMWRDAGAIVEQSSAQIWAAVCDALRSAVAIAGVDPGRVSGIGVDATCSLVVLGLRCPSPWSLGPVALPWLDHRRLRASDCRVACLDINEDRVRARRAGSGHLAKRDTG